MRPDQQHVVLPRRIQAARRITGGQSQIGLVCSGEQANGQRSVLRRFGLECSSRFTGQYEGETEEKEEQCHLHRVGEGPRVVKQH
jgi:hypothetical protein